MSPADHAMYDAHAVEINHAISAVRRCRRIRGEDADDFAQNIRVWLLEDATALLRFDGESDANAYFFRIIEHKFLDWSRHCDGRWRPSAAARREGPLAVEFERLVERDGLTPREAIETLHAQRGASYKNLDDLWLRLPGAGRTRSKPRVLSLDAEGITARSARAFAARAEDLDRDRDGARIADHVRTSLNRALSNLSADQQRLLVEHFGVGRAQAAACGDGRHRARNRAGHRLALDILRELLASCGIGWPEVRQALEAGGIEINRLTNVIEPATGIVQLSGTGSPPEYPAVTPC